MAIKGSYITGIYTATSDITLDINIGNSIISNTSNPINFTLPSGALEGTEYLIYQVNTGNGTIIAPVGENVNGGGFAGSILGPNPYKNIVKVIKYDATNWMATALA